MLALTLPERGSPRSQFPHVLIPTPPEATQALSRNAVSEKPPGFSQLSWWQAGPDLLPDYSLISK